MADEPRGAPDTPIQAPTVPPPHWSDRVKSFVGDLARPFAIYGSTAGAAYSNIVLAYAVYHRAVDPGTAAFLAAAFWGGPVALYTGKAWEVAKGKAADADIAKAQTGATP